MRVSSWSRGSWWLSSSQILSCARFWLEGLFEVFLLSPRTLQKLVEPVPEQLPMRFGRRNEIPTSGASVIPEGPRPLFSAGRLLQPLCGAFQLFDRRSASIEVVVHHETSPNTGKGFEVTAACVFRAAKEAQRSLDIPLSGSTNTNSAPSRSCAARSSHSQRMGNRTSRCDPRGNCRTPR